MVRYGEDSGSLPTGVALISHSREAIFVHIPKTGGSSIEQVFLQDSQLSDESRLPLVMGSYVQYAPGPPALEHLSLSEAVEFGYASAPMLSRYYIFTFVRNPYERVFSTYQYLNLDRILSFPRFVALLEDGEFDQKLGYFLRPQFDFLGEMAQYVDFIGRFENFGTDAPHALSTAGLHEVPLPRVEKTAKKSTLKGTLGAMLKSPRLSKEIDLRRAVRAPRRAPASSYRDFYDDDSLARVARIYRVDFEAFGYQMAA